MKNLFIINDVPYSQEELRERNWDLKFARIFLWCIGLCTVSIPVFLSYLNVFYYQEHVEPNPIRWQAFMLIAISMILIGRFESWVTPYLAKNKLILPDNNTRESCELFDLPERQTKFFTGRNHCKNQKNPLW